MKNPSELLRMLRREPGRPTLFEPFPSQKLVTQIIWRGGGSLWNTTFDRVSTMLSFYDNIGADTAVIEADGDNIAEVLDVCEKKASQPSVTIFSNDIEALKAADRHPTVCALCTKAPVFAKDFTKPIIFIAGRDVILNIENSIERGLAGVYISDNLELLWKRYHNDIAILGGLADSIFSGAPARIYSRIRDIHDMTAGSGYALGTGISGIDADYLGFISMLYMYNTISEEQK